MASFEMSGRDWKQWYVSAAPEQEELPGEWDSQCNELQKMIVVRSLRPDRAGFEINYKFVFNLYNGICI